MNPLLAFCVEFEEAPCPIPLIAEEPDVLLSELELLVLGKTFSLSKPARRSFAIAFIFAFIVVYDALNLRYQCGLHAKQINEINAELHRSVQLNESLGHRMCEVIAGCMIEIIIAWI